MRKPPVPQLVCITEKNKDWKDVPSGRPQRATQSRHPSPRDAPVVWHDRLVTPSMETAGFQTARRETPWVRETPPAGRGRRSHDLPPRPPPHFAERVRASPPSPCPLLGNPDAPSLPAHLPKDPTSPKPLTAISPGPPRTVLRVPELAGAEPQRALRVAGKGKGGPRAHSKLKLETHPANFWAAARNARRPELFPQRRALPQGATPGCNPPDGSRRRPRKPCGASPSRHLPNGWRLELNPPCHRRDASAFSSPGQSRRSAAVPAGTPGGEAGARPPSHWGRSLHRSLPTPSPFYLRQSCP